MKVMREGEYEVERCIKGTELKVNGYSIYVENSNWFDLAAFVTVDPYGKDLLNLDILVLLNGEEEVRVARLKNLERQSQLVTG
jgi:hypothetical protein